MAVSNVDSYEKNSGMPEHFHGGIVKITESKMTLDYFLKAYQNQAYKVLHRLTRPVKILGQMINPEKPKTIAIETPKSHHSPRRIYCIHVCRTIRFSRSYM